jgi:hypothetical protein
MPKLLVLNHGQSQLRFFYLGNETVEIGQAASPPTGNTKMYDALVARMTGWSVVVGNSGAANTSFLDDWVVPETAGDAGFTVNATDFFTVVSNLVSANPDTTKVAVNHVVQTQDWKNNLLTPTYGARYIAAMKKFETKMTALLGALPWMWGYCHIGERNASVDPDNITDARRFINAIAGVEKHPLVSASDRINRFRILTQPGIWRSSRTTANAASNNPLGTPGDFTHQGVSGSRRLGKEMGHEIARWAGGTVESTMGHPRCTAAWKINDTSFKARFFITPGSVLKTETPLAIPVQISANIIGQNAGETLGPVVLTPTALSIDNTRAAQGIAEITCTMSAPMPPEAYLYFDAELLDYVRVGELGTTPAERKLCLLYEDASPGAVLSVAADFADIASPYVPMPVMATHAIPLRDGDPDVSALSDYAEALCMSTLMTGTRYAALGTGSSDTGFTEFTGGGYARASGSFTLVGSQASNTAALVFPSPTADWGIATHIAVFDASSGGNMIWHGPTEAPLQINNADPAPQLAAGQLILSIN